MFHASILLGERTKCGTLFQFAIKMMISIPEALTIIEQGGVIAYPTEAVYGLGCDPFNKKAVDRLLNLKIRSPTKGLILLINSYEQLWSISALDTLNPLIQTLKSSWPGPVTYLCPKHKSLPNMITGTHKTIAVRMTNHPVANALCQNGPIISTSANLSNTSPCMTPKEVDKQFAKSIDGIVSGELGNARAPSTIIELETGKVVR